MYMLLLLLAALAHASVMPMNYCGYSQECGVNADCDCVPLLTACAASETCQLTSAGVMVVTAATFAGAVLLMLCCCCFLCFCRPAQCCPRTNPDVMQQPIVYNQHMAL